MTRFGDPTTRADFAMSPATFPQQVSGHWIATRVHQVQDCHVRGCRIRHAQTTIPFNHDPVHDMENGDTFVLGAGCPPTSG